MKFYNYDIKRIRIGFIDYGQEIKIELIHIVILYSCTFKILSYWETGNAYLKYNLNNVCLINLSEGMLIVLKFLILTSDT